MRIGTRTRQSGFTLMELLIVIAIIGILSTVVLVMVVQYRERAMLNRTLLEMRSMQTAIELYTADNEGDYPADVSRGLPPGLELYLHNPADAGAWPDAPFPGSVYDWDAWTDPVTSEPIYQLSVRFCPQGGPLSACNFPDESWAAGFGINSALYFCFSGPCRPHINEDADYPGYCVNC